MILPDFKAFPRTGRILGVDWGLSRIGLAVSDGTGDFVFHGKRQLGCVGKYQPFGGVATVAQHGGLFGGGGIGGHPCDLCG